MKRKALLIGCSGKTSIADGIRQDIDNYISFLTSFKGGSYYDWEIVSLLEQDKCTIITKLQEIRAENNDMVFSVFTGHGEYDDIKRNERVLEVDRRDFLYESEIVNLSSRQILILDTCAGLKSARILRESIKASAYAMNSLDSQQQLRARAKYEQECMRCPEQLIRLFSSRRGEPSYMGEDGVGSLYSSNLLKTLSANILPRLDVVSAHGVAAKIVEKESADRQHPSSCFPKFSSDLLLPGSIN